MLTIRKSIDRGKTQTPWLVSRHTFAFGDFLDPSFVRFGPLIALNEDRLAAGSGYREHPHQEAEVFAYVIEGTLAHRDSTGGERVLRSGEIRRMRAGASINHSEANASASSVCHVLQIWISPSSDSPEPFYEVKSIDPQAVRNRFARIAAPSPRETELPIGQDAELWASHLDTDRELVRPMQQGRRCWLQVAKGEILLNDHALSSGDGAAVTDEARFFVRARRPSELLLLDLV